MFYLKQKEILINLILMSIVWLSTSFSYYLLLSLVNTFDNVYETAVTGSIAEIVAYTVSGLLYEKIGVKLSLVISFALSTMGGILILAYGLEHESDPGFYICFLLTKFGVSCLWNIIFNANQYFFPVLFAATAMGVCNFLARLSTSFSYLASEIDEPTPMYLFTFICGLSCIASTFLRTKKE